MSSFASHLRSLRGENVDLVSVSLAQKPGGAHEWKEEAGSGYSRLLEYHGALPHFGDVIRDARTLDDVRQAYAPLTEALRLKLKEEQPDVVLVNGTYFMPWCLMMAARSLRLPVVLYYHGSLTKETAHWDDPRARRLLTRLEASFDRADIRHIFPSALIKDFVEREVFLRPLPRRHAAVLPNPVPEAFFRARGRKTKPRIAFVGRWTRVKNPAFMVRLVELNRRAGNPFEIWILTDPASRKHAAKILHDRVRYARPRKRNADLASFYRRMSAVICPSHFETYGNVAQEAVAAGTPAFVSRNMGVAEILCKVGLDEFIVDFSNPRGVFEALQGAVGMQIDRTPRRALRRIAGAPVVHRKLLEYLRA
jgi:glycosyltransferase involved in cell wall biosynthesis